MNAANNATMNHDVKSLSFEYGSIDGEQYFVPIPGLPEDYGWPTGSTTSTVASGESDNLLERGDVCSSPPHNTLGDIVFDLLGFQANPLRFSSTGTTRNSSAADLRLSMLSNFSTAYNVVSISLTLHIMDKIYLTTPQDESLCSSALIAGMIVGQLAGGTLGDVLGRHRAMSVVMLLQVVAAFGSSLSCEMAHLSIYKILAAWRFILGLGAGGVYPLAATLTAESSQSSQDRGKAVALTFSFQGVGYLVVPLFTWLVVTVLGEGYSDLSWRLILGFGALPGIVLTIVRVSRRRRQMTTSTTKSTAQKHEPRIRTVPVSVVSAIESEQNLICKMLGTGGCWLLFDILFYGNTLFQPVVLSAAFGSAETVQKAARDTAIIASMALPGYLVSVFAVGRQSPKYIQMQGFFVMGILYLFIGALFDRLSGQRAALLITYGSTFFFSNYGPNATTFMLPSMTFSRSCRSTLNGICAACGKAGALIGTVGFVTAADRFGQKAVFLACALVSFGGCLISWLCISSQVGMDDDGDGIQSHMAAKQQSWTEERGHTKVPMRVVYSEPSLMDYQ
jgi:PHS family inorganic phosphate transporter-like MFS transporter